MSKAKLRSIGGSVMVAVPKPFLAQANLGPGSTVTIAIENGNILLKPVVKPRYTLDELLAKCNFGKRVPRAEREWQDATPVGREAI